MESDKNRLSYKSNSGRVWAGIIIIVIGGLLLLNQLNVFLYFPDWMFSWQMMMIIIGLIIGGRSNFRNPASFILLGLGIFFLLSNYTDFSIGRLFWPLMIIIAGSWLLFGRSHYRGPHKPGGLDNGRRKYTKGYDWDKRVNYGSGTTEVGSEEPGGISNEATSDLNGPSLDQPTASAEENAEYIDSVSIFGNVKKNVISKNFKGGEIVNIMGGADINLMHADIQGPVVLEVVQIFGGTKIIIPAHWKVHPEMAAVFGGVEDQRFTFNVVPDDTRILYIKGTSIFGGITIKSV